MNATVAPSSPPRTLLGRRRACCCWCCLPLLLLVLASLVRAARRRRTTGPTWPSACSAASRSPPCVPLLGADRRHRRDRPGDRRRLDRLPAVQAAEPARRSSSPSWPCRDRRDRRVFAARPGACSPGSSSSARADRLAVAYAVGALVAGVAYCALFLLLAVLTRNAVVVGLVYALVWEAAVGNSVPGAQALSIQQWSLAVTRAVVGADRADELELTAAVRPASLRRPAAGRPGRRHLPGRAAAAQPAAHLRRVGDAGRANRVDMCRCAPVGWPGEHPLAVHLRRLDRPGPHRDFWEEALGWRRTPRTATRSSSSRPPAAPRTASRRTSCSCGCPRRSRQEPPAHRPAARRPGGRGRPARGAGCWSGRRRAGRRVTWVVLADPDGNEFCVLRALTAEELAE